MKEAILKTIISLLRSTIVMILMFVIGFSVVTREFPPNFQRFNQMISQFELMQNSTKAVLEKKKQLDALQADQGFVEESDVQELKELELKRNDAALALAKANPLVDSTELPASPTENSAQEIQELRRRINVLEEKVLRLQSKVDNSEK